MTRQIKVAIIGDASKLEQALARAGKASGKLGKIFKTGLKGLGAGLATATTGIAAVGAAGTKWALDFESQMAEVKTLLPTLSTEGFNKLESDVLALSKEMGIATKDAVPALYQAISAGVPPDNVIDFMRTAGEASIGGITDLETSVDGITSVVNAYGEEVVSAGEASDLMFTAVKFGKTDFAQLSGSLFNVIPTAASLGVEFESVATSLAAMTAQGVPTRVATTQLRQLFVETSKSGTKLDKALRDMTGKGFAGLIESGADSIDVLNDLRSSMPDQEFRDLFGSVEASNAALALTGPNAEAVQTVMAQMQASTGATGQAFQTVADTTRFQLSKALNEVKVSLTEVGGQLLPHLASFLKSVVVPAIGAFSDRLPAIGRVASTVFNGIKQLWQSVLRPVFGALRAAASEAKDWIVGNWPTIQKIFKQVWGEIKQLWASVLKPVLDLAWAALKAAKDWIVGNWPTIQKIFKQVWGEIKQLWASVLKPVLDLAWAALTEVWQLVRDNWPQIKQVIKTVFKGVQTAWESALQPALEGIVGALREVVRWVKEHFRDLLPLAAALGTTAAAIGVYVGALKVQALVTKGVATATKIYAAAQLFLNTVMKANPIILIVSLIAILASALVTAWMTSETFREKVRAVWAGVKEAVQAFVGFFTKTIPNMFRQVYNKTRGILANIKDTIVGAFKAVVGWLRERWPEIATVLSGPFIVVTALATDAFGIRSKLIGAFNTIKTKAKEIFGKIATTIRSKLKAVKDKAIRIATNLWEGVTGKFGEIRDKVFEVFSGIFTDVQRVMIDIWNKAVELAGDIGTGLKDGIVDGLFGLATDLYESLKEKLLSVVDKIKGFFSIFSPSGRMADELGKPIAEGVIVGLLTGLGPRPEKFGGALTKAIEHGRKVIERSRGVLAKPFDGVSGDLLRAFDAQSSATETESEKKLRLIAERRQSEDQERALSDANKGLALAQTGDEEGNVDPEAVADAQREVDRLLEDIEITRLERQAVTERRDYEEKRGRQRVHLDERLAALLGAMGKEGAEAGKATKKIARIMRSYGIDFKTAGAHLGQEFARALNAEIRRAAKAAGALNVTVGATTKKVSKKKVSKVPALADGGTAVGRGLAMVGERGPEILSLNRGASVVPLSKSSSMTIENLNVYPSGAAADDPRALAAALSWELRLREARA